MFGEQAVTGFSPFQNPNPNLKWESTAQTNLAFDYGLMNNRITGSLEYYVKNTRDLLLSVAVPQPAVASTRYENIGKIQNKGNRVLDRRALAQPGATATGPPESSSRQTRTKWWISEAAALSLAAI